MKIPLRAYWTLLSQYIRPQWRAAVLLAFLLLGGIGLQLISPQIIRYFIDQAQAGAAIEILTRAALLYLLQAIIQQAVSVVAKYTSENVAWRTTNALRYDLAAHCLHLDLSFFNSHSPGELIERLDGDVTTLANFFSQFVIQFSGNVILLAGILAVLFVQDWRVGLALGFFTLLALSVMMRFRNLGVPYWAGERQASAELFGFLEERLAGTEDIRASGAELYVMRCFYQLMRTLLQKALKAGLVVNIFLNIMFFLFAAGTAAAFALGAYLYQNQTITIGTVYLIFAYSSMLQRPIDTIVHQIEDLQKAGAGIGRIKTLLEQHSKLPVDLTGAHVAAPQGALAISFQDVTFGYDDGPPGAGQQGADHSQVFELTIGKEIVLNNVSFKLNPGATLGLLGRTGSGKTTLARLLFRFYNPDHGSIHIASDHFPGTSLDLRDLPLAEFRKRIGLVTQDIQLFNATVRENLTFFDRGVSDERIFQVLRELGLADWLEALPRGLDTVLDAGGGGLSAGEAQLLAFVRVFLKDPGLVVLDEASSRLDPATEGLIEKAVTRLAQGRTTIIIAHHLRTVLRASEIMVLENGRVLEFGERERLERDSDSHFYHLLQAGMEEVLV